MIILLLFVGLFCGSCAAMEKNDQEEPVFSFDRLQQEIKLLDEGDRRCSAEQILKKIRFTQECIEKLKNWDPSKKLINKLKKLSDDLIAIKKKLRGKIGKPSLKTLLKVGGYISLSVAGCFLLEDLLLWPCCDSYIQHYLHYYLLKSDCNYSCVPPF